MQHHIMGRPISGLHVELPGDVQSPQQCLQPREGYHEARRAVTGLHQPVLREPQHLVSVRDDQVVDNYKKGLRDCKVFEKIHESGATKVALLMEVVNKLIDTEEALVNQFNHDDKQDAGTSGAAGDSSSKFRKQPSEVLTADGQRPSTFNIEEFNAVLDNPCTFHEGGTHTVRECHQFKRGSARPRTPSDLEAMEIGHPHVATTTTAATTDVAVRTTIAVTTNNVTTTSRRITARSATSLPRWRQATPMTRSSTPRGRST
jgi:hypothetical protein